MCKREEEEVGAAPLINLRLIVGYMLMAASTQTAEGTVTFPWKRFTCVHPDVTAPDKAPAAGRWRLTATGRPERCRQPHTHTHTRHDSLQPSTVPPRLSERTETSVSTLSSR